MKKYRPFDRRISIYLSYPFELFPIILGKKITSCRGKIIYFLCFRIEIKWFNYEKFIQKQNKLNNKINGENNS